MFQFVIYCLFQNPQPSGDLKRSSKQDKSKSEENKKSKKSSKMFGGLRGGFLGESGKNDRKGNKHNG